MKNKTLKTLQATSNAKNMEYGLSIGMELIDFAGVNVNKISKFGNGYLINKAILRYQGNLDDYIY